METLSTILVFCEWNPSVIGGSPHKGQVMRSLWWFLCYQPKQVRARHLFFPQLGSRTTIKYHGLVRNRNLLGHDHDILFWHLYNNKRKQNIWENIYMFACFFISGFTVSEAHCRMINHQCSCLEVVLFTSIIHFYVNYQEYISNR